MMLNIQGISSSPSWVYITLVGVVMFLNSEWKILLYGYPGTDMLYIDTGVLKTLSHVAMFSTFDLLF